MAKSVFRDHQTGAFVHDKNGFRRLSVRAERLAEDIHLAREYDCKGLTLQLGANEPKINGVDSEILKQFSYLSIESSARTKDNVRIDELLGQFDGADRLVMSGTGAVLESLASLPPQVARLNIDVRLLKDRKDLQFSNQLQRLRVSGLRNGSDVTQNPIKAEFLSLDMASLDGFDMAMVPETTRTFHLYSRKGSLVVAGDVTLRNVALLRIHVGSIDVKGQIIAPKLSHCYLTELSSPQAVLQILQAKTAFLGCNLSALTDADINKFGFETEGKDAFIEGTSPRPFPNDFLHSAPA